MSFLSKLLRLLREISLNVAGYRKLGLIYDEPSNDEEIAEEVLGAKKIDLPESVDLRYGFVSYDQGRTNHCAAYSITGVSEAMNRKEHGFVRFDPEEIWVPMLKNGADEKYGATLQCANKSFLEMGGPSCGGKRYPATGIARIENRTAHSMRKWLARGFPISTGVVTSGWSFAKLTDWLKITKTGGGHAIWIYGYGKLDNGEPVFWCQNSWGNWGLNSDGNFYIKEADIGKLFSLYILYDARDL